MKLITADELKTTYPDAHRELLSNTPFHVTVDLTEYQFFVLGNGMTVIAEDVTGEDVHYSWSSVTQDWISI